MVAAESLLNLNTFFEVQGYLVDILSGRNKLTSEEFETLLNNFHEIIEKFDDRPEGQTMILELFVKIWEIEALSSPEFKLSLIKKHANYFEDTLTSGKVSPLFTDKVLNSIKVENGSLVAVCGAGEVRSYSFVQNVKVLEKENLLYQPQANFGVADFLTTVRTFDPATEKTLVLFTNTKGFEVLTLVTRLIELVMRDQATLKDKRVVLDIMKGDFSSFGISNFVLVEKNP